jgi:hypothetical protein
MSDKILDSYLQPNITIGETIEIIKSKIESETPFALTRFGDGEIYILNKTCSEDFLKKNCSLWGYNYPSESNNFLDDCSSIIKHAIVKSDIIGIMDKNTKVLPKGFYNESIWSIKKSFALNLGVNLSNQLICDHMISRHEEFGSVSSMKEILQGKSVNIITPHKDIFESKNMSKFLEADVKITEHPHSINFNNRSEFLKSLENIQEKVVLLGIGLQKDYGVYLKETHGKIAIDMGATLDAWAGMITRPWFSRGNLQSHLLI